MFYPAKFTQEDNGYTVSFRDMKEAITCGSSFDEAMLMAEDIILCWIDVYFEKNEFVPMPSDGLYDCEHWVFLPDSIFAKVLLHNEMLRAKISKAELARLMGTNSPEIQRILSARHKTKIDTISKALSKLGKHLTLSLA